MLESAQQIAVLVGSFLLILVLAYILKIVHIQTKRVKELEARMKLYEKGKEELAKTEK